MFKKTEKAAKKQSTDADDLPRNIPLSNSQSLINKITTDKNQYVLADAGSPLTSQGFLSPPKNRNPLKEKDMQSSNIEKLETILEDPNEEESSKSELIRF
ncbi:hypothetical protein [Legionella resiliens]|uniref:Uncharacterized protein n=1 Tax=Legionella resiliens TaxID=2905958 RepID=A0ABS8WZD7_9GAMM|nr:MULTISPECIES: hypothetical protein [unclassified Legionella]MCE0722682.1 hypothetical protein [Legionella sp. 9fVS26]MCE3531835.1 hypothetical protein [Legionella sp. 8cVS16]